MFVILMNIFRLGTVGVVLETESMQNEGKIQRGKKKAKIIFRDGAETFLALFSVVKQP